MIFSKANLNYLLIRSVGTKKVMLDEVQRVDIEISLNEVSKLFIDLVEVGKIEPDAFFGSFHNLITEVVVLTIGIVSSVCSIWIVDTVVVRAIQSVISVSLKGIFTIVVETQDLRVFGAIFLNERVKVIYVSVVELIRIHIVLDRVVHNLSSIVQGIEILEIVRVTVDFIVKEGKHYVLNY